MKELFSLRLPKPPRWYRRDWGDDHVAAVEWAHQTGVLTVDEFEELFTFGLGVRVVVVDA